MFVLGIVNSSITSMINTTSAKMYQTTQMSTEQVSSDGKPLERPPVPYNILYMIIALVCIFVILFGLFVGIYFYKHCIKLTNISDEKGESQFNLNEGYKSLNQFDANRSVNSLRDSTYLEPLFDARLHYNEIENQDEISATGIVRVSIKRQNEEIFQICTRSKSCHLLMHELDETVAYNSKHISCTHSL